MSYATECFHIELRAIVLSLRVGGLITNCSLSLQQRLVWRLGGEDDMASGGAIFLASSDFHSLR